ncbi:MAG: CRISPR-associated endonuclease Cas2 [Actinomycetota bacterium]|nr:CRISPR-associated endonuclease Cas2 [Actinomycetota bacterium]
MEFNRINAYRIMWLFVFFDLPTNTKGERKAASGFRTKLLKDGFVMMQYSVYIRHCASRESSDVHVRRVRSVVPAKGQVSILNITDRQYGDIINFWGKKTSALPPPKAQLEIF